MTPEMKAFILLSVVKMVVGFTIIMIWGVVIGTYSTIYIATPVLYYLNLRTAGEKAKVAAQPAAH